MNDSSEKALWYLFVNGDLSAFSTLFKIYYPLLHNYGLKISSDEMLTEDCLQSFFVYLYNHRQGISTVKQIKSYLFVSFRRAILKKLKEDRRLTAYKEILESKNIFGFSPEDLSIKQEFAKIRTSVLATLMNKLSVREREIIYLKYYSNLRTNEITEVMDISYQSALNTLQKAFTKLRAAAESEEILRALER